jgi:hydroxymethylglutaryl-CoA reductase (NADPH)
MPEQDSSKIGLIPRFGVPGNRRVDVDARRAWAERITGATLRHAGQFSIDPEQTTGNLENMIGVSQMPLGLAGPLRILGEFAAGEFYVPLATTEGALVRSYERGMIALTRSGGVRTRVLADHVHISPLFRLASLPAAVAFVAWIAEHFADIKGEAEATTRHGKLLAIRPHLFGRSVILNFDYSSGDAMGLNMITVATDRACRFIAVRTDVEKWFIESNLSSEKKLSSYNLIHGKGKEVVAEATLPKGLVSRNLHATPADIVEAVSVFRLGAMKAGIPAPNAHFANGLAALYLACGQDVASVVNASAGFTQMELDKNGDLYASVYLPSLILGTVGGGTAVGTHGECLEMLGCAGAGKAKRLEVIAAATVLAGVLSITAAIVSSEFAQAHDSRGRTRIAGR